jgi:hypothetical protein
MRSPGTPIASPVRSLTMGAVAGAEIVAPIADLACIAQRKAF